MVEYLGAQSIQNALPYLGHENELDVVGSEMDEGYNEETQAHQVESSHISFGNGPVDAEQDKQGYGHVGRRVEHNCGQAD